MDTVVYRPPVCPRCGGPMVVTGGAVPLSCPRCSARSEPAASAPAAATPKTPAATPPPAKPATEDLDSAATLVRQPAYVATRTQGVEWIGRTLAGRYRVDAFVAEESLGSVYRVTDVQTKRVHSVKLLNSRFAKNPLFVSRFMQEAQIAASIKAPGVAEVYDFGTEGKVPFYVTEHLRGGTLEARLKAQGVLAPREAVEIVSAAADAVSAAHARGIIHRDLQPEKIFLVAAADGSERVKVLDFGLSKAVEDDPMGGDPQGTITSFMCARPEFMSPEQAGGKASDARSDVYSLAAVLYALLAGAPPFESTRPMAVVAMHLSAAPPPLASKRPGLAMPRELEAAVMKALSKRPEDRYATMAEFGSALRRAVGIAVPPTKPPTPKAASAAINPPRVRLALLVALLVVAALVILAAVLFVRRGAPARQPVATVQPAVPVEVAPPAPQQPPPAAPEAAAKPSPSNLDAPAEPPDAVELKPSPYRDPKEDHLVRDSNVGTGGARASPARKRELMPSSGHKEPSGTR